MVLRLLRPYRYDIEDKNIQDLWRKEMNKKEKAVQLFSEKMHCSQSVLAAFAEECGITEIGRAHV